MPHPTGSVSGHIMILCSHQNHSFNFFLTWLWSIRSDPNFLAALWCVTWLLLSCSGQNKKIIPTFIGQKVLSLSYPTQLDQISFLQTRFLWHDILAIDVFSLARIQRRNAHVYSCFETVSKNPLIPGSQLFLSFLLHRLLCWESRTINQP